MAARKILSEITEHLFSSTFADHDEHGEAEHGEHDETVEQILLLAPFCLLLGNIIRNLCVEFKIPFPYTVLLLLLGIVLGILEYNLDLGLLGTAIDSVKHMSPHLLLQAFVAPLVFESAFNTEYHVIRREFGQALILAFPGVILNCILTAIFCVYAFPYGWTWEQAIAFGAIISATDPVAVVGLLRELGASKRLATLIEGESLLNDGSAFVVFAIAMEFVKGNNPTVGQVVAQFCTLTFGGIGMGILFGIAAVLWLRWVFNDERIEIVITLVSCYLVFHVCENELHASGVLGVVFLGLTISKSKVAISPHVEESMAIFWETISYIMNTLIFIFGGIIIVLGVFEDETTAQTNGNGHKFVDFFWNILLYVILHITRAISIGTLWWFLKNMGYGVTWKDGIVLTLSGLRGVIAIAMALIVKLEPIDSEDTPVFKDLVMFHVCGIVFWTLAINGSCIKYVVQYLGLNKPSKQARDILVDAMQHLRDSTKKEIEAMKSNPHYGGADWQQVIAYLPSYAHLLGKKNQAKQREINQSCAWCKCCCFRKSKCCKKAHSKETLKSGSMDYYGETELANANYASPRFTDSKSDAEALRGRFNESKFLARRFGIDKHTVREQHLEEVMADLDNLKQPYDGTQYKKGATMVPLQEAAESKEEDEFGQASIPLIDRNANGHQQQNVEVDDEDETNGNDQEEESAAVIPVVPLRQDSNTNLGEVGNDEKDKESDDEFRDENVVDFNDMNPAADEHDYHFSNEDLLKPPKASPLALRQSGGSLKNVLSSLDTGLPNVNDTISFNPRQKSALLDPLDDPDGFTSPIQLILQKSEEILTQRDTIIQSDADAQQALTQCEQDLMMCRNQLKHRILLVLKRSYHEAYEEGIISMDSYEMLDNAVSSALDDNDCEILSNTIKNCFKINRFVSTAYSTCVNKMTQYWLFKQLSSAMEVGIVFVHSFQELASKIECVPAIAQSELLRGVLEDMEGNVKYIKHEWLQIQEIYPSIYTALQTRHAVQTIIHHEAKHISELFQRGLLDETEYHKMMQHLAETQHKLYFQSFYGVSEIRDNTATKKQTVLSVLFLTKLQKTNMERYNQKISCLMKHLNAPKFYEKGRRIIKRNGAPTTTLRSAYGIYILVSGTASIVINNNSAGGNDSSEEQKDSSTEDEEQELQPTFSLRKQEKKESGSRVNQKEEIYLAKGSIIGGWSYLTQQPYLNTVVCKTPCELYVLTDKVMNTLLEDEPNATQYLWKQVAIHLILSQFYRNNVSVFAWLDETSIHKMCHDGTFREFKGNVYENKLVVSNCYALLLDGVARQNNKVYQAPDVLLQGAGIYRMSMGAKVLIFDHDPQVRMTSPGLIRTRKSGGYRSRKL